MKAMREARERMKAKLQGGLKKAQAAAQSATGLAVPGGESKAKIEMDPVLQAVMGSEGQRKNHTKLRRASSSSSTSSSMSYLGAAEDFFERTDRQAAGPKKKREVERVKQIRRKRTDAQILKDLPEGFYKEKFDPVQFTLDGIPEDKGKLQAWTREQLEVRDVEADVVTTALTKAIMENYDAFGAGMQKIKDINMDLGLAAMSVLNSRRSLALSRQNLITCSLQIMNKQRSRSRLVKTARMLHQVRRLTQFEARINEQLRQQQFPEAVETLMWGWEGLRDESLRAVKVLDRLRQRFGETVATLRQGVDARLKSLCLRFDAERYEAILKAYILLDRHFSSQQQPASADGTREVTYEIVVPDGIASGQEFVVAFPDGQRTVTCPAGSAAGDKIRVKVRVKVEKSDATAGAGAVAGLSQQLQRNFLDTIQSTSLGAVQDVIKRATGGDNVDAQQRRKQFKGMDFSALAASLHAKKIDSTSCLISVAEGIVNIIHSHYLLSQWHRDPFNVANRQEAYLHRCAIDAPIQGQANDKDTAADGAAAADDGEDDATAGGVKAPPGGWDAKLVAVADSGLQNSRKIVWHHMQARVAEFVSSAFGPDAWSGKAGAALSSTEATLKALAETNVVCTFLARVGEHYSLSLPGDILAPGLSSHELTSALKNACARYLDKLHSDSLRLLTDGLNSEEWHRLPVDLGSLGGTEAIVLHRWAPAIKKIQASPWLQRFNAFLEIDGLVERDAAVEGKHPAFAKVRVVLQQFPTCGNPFSERYVAAADKASSTARPKQGDDGDAGDGADKDTSSADGAAASDAGRRSRLRRSSSFFNVHDKEKEDAKAEAVAAAAAANQTNKTFLITSTALNIFASNTGKYVQVMELLPDAAGEAFTGLTQLFDQYLHTVFTAFVPADLQAQFLQPGVSPVIKTKWHRTRFTMLRNMLVRVREGRAGLTAAEQAGGARRFPMPGFRLSPMINVDDPSTLYALPERVVATESLDFLFEVFNCFKLRVLEVLMQANNNSAASSASSTAAMTHASFCADFFGNTGKLIESAKHFVYYQAAAGIATAMAIQSRSSKKSKSKKDVSSPEEAHSQISSLVAAVRFDRSSASGQCSKYVKTVLEQLQRSWAQMRTPALEEAIPPHVQSVIWTHVVGYVLEQMLHGFASVKKCSVQGRGLMSLDLSDMLRGLERIHPISLDAKVTNWCRGRAHVSNYLKAFYYEQADLMQWISDNKGDYPAWMMRSLVTVSVGAKMKKKVLRTLVEKVDEIYAQR